MLGCNRSNENTATDHEQINNIWTTIYNSSTQPLPHRTWTATAQHLEIQVRRIFLQTLTTTWVKQTCREWLRVNSLRICHVNRLVLHKVKLKGEVRIKGDEKVKVLHCQFQKENTRSFGFSELKKNNYNTVAKQQGVTKSLVFKWEKHKSKILAELTLNKMKKNRCSRPLRQRRRKRSQQTQLLLAKFKLQRAVASKVSKLWLENEIENWSMLWHTRSYKI